MALVMVMISQMARRARWSGLFTRIWEITAIKLEARKLLVWFTLFRGQRVDDAVQGLGGAGGVQSAEHQVSGFRRRHGHGMVSASRISPTRITSGSSRMAARTPSAKEGRWVPSSRWIT
jgi:hypothetical protein